MPRTQVVMVDPGNFTPHYVANLCCALEEQDCEVELITSAPFFEPVPQAGNYSVRCRFVRLASERLGSCPMLRRRAWLRKSIKALSYPAGLWRLWKALKDRPPGVLHLQWALIPALDLPWTLSLSTPPGSPRKRLPAPGSHHKKCTRFRMGIWASFRGRT